MKMFVVKEVLKPNGLTILKLSILTTYLGVGNVAELIWVFSTREND